MGFVQVDNTSLPRFSQPDCEAVGAFFQVLRYDNNCLCLPVCLIVRVLKHMEVQCLVRGI